MKRVIQFAVFFCILSSLTACDKAVENYKEARMRQETEAVNKIFSVTVTDLQRNDDKEQPQLKLIFDLNNQCMENIIGCKGKLVLRDVHDELIKTQVVDYKEMLRGGHKLQGFVFIVNGGDSLENYEKTKRFDLEKGNFNLEFVPDIVVFESMKVLRRHDID